MSRIPQHVRQVVVEWDEDAPRGAVEYFCRRHGVSRSWFYRVRAQVAREGAAAALSKQSTRPRRSPSRVPDAVKAEVLALRRRLTSEGKDAGALSIQDRMCRDGFTPLVSVSTIARILDREYLVARNRRKRPKSSYRRFQAEYINESWQSDAFEMTLTSGLTVVIVEIIDDCSRFSLAEHPGPAETAHVVLDAFKKTIDTYGLPVRVHTDNGAAFNRERYNVITRLQNFLNGLGIKTITGRPMTPRTQGKVERAHQTIQNFIKAHDPLTLDDLDAVLEEYRDWYNNDRSNQALPPHTAPGEAYAAWEKIAATGVPIRPAGRSPVAPDKRKVINCSHTVRLTTSKRIRVGGYRFKFGKRWVGQEIHYILEVTGEEPYISWFDVNGAHMITMAWPPPHPETGLARLLSAHTPPELPSTMS